MKKLARPFIPDWLAFLRIDPYEMRVLIYIISWGNSFLPLPLEKTADNLAISKRKLQDCLTALVNCGLVIKKDNGHRKPADYIAKCNYKEVAE